MHLSCLFLALCLLGVVAQAARPKRVDGGLAGLEAMASLLGGAGWGGQLQLQ
jgi:hypothetical protein